MQTRSILAVAPVMITAASAAAVSAMPSLGGPNWYDWSSASVATPVAVATTTVNDWDTWTAWSAASVSVATPSAVVVASSWAAVSASTTAVPAWSAVSSSVPYENPFTIYTTMTNSWGVITGMPSVVTSQPTQPVPAGWSTSSSVKVESVNATTLATATLKSSTASGFQQSSTATIAVHTGAAAATTAGGAGVAMAVLGLVISLL